MKPIPEVEREFEKRVESLGMELVESEWAGSRKRPIIRLRVDLPDSVPGRGVTVADCAKASRELEAWLDEHAALPERYVLEVSSPGVERPLKRRRDFARFAGSEVALHLREQGARDGPGRVEGVLEGIENTGNDEESDYDVVVRNADGAKASFARRDVRRAHLVFRWNEDD